MSDKSKRLLQVWLHLRPIIIVGIIGFFGFKAFDKVHSSSVFRYLNESNSKTNEISELKSQISNLEEELNYFRCIFCENQN